jgi:hypothetical protein
MDFIRNGTKIEHAVGPPTRPRVIRWTTWSGRNDLRQSYLLVTDEGGVAIDPVKLPPEGLDYLRGLVDEVVAVVTTCPNHDRDARWFGNQVRSPVFISSNSPARAQKAADQTFTEGRLPGGLAAMAPSHEHGETWLLWKIGRRKLLFCGDSIYGQTDPGGFAGYEPKFWMQADGIRLYMPSIVPKSEMKERYRPLLDLKLTEIYNGHNPRSISDPTAALTDVFRRGNTR